MLKGANGASRQDSLRAIGFDSRLAGTGAQVHWELSLGLAMRRAGWKLILDPRIAVDHYPARRFDEDQRTGFNEVAHVNATANETLVVYEHLAGMRRLAFIFWAAMIGTGATPGLAQLPRLWLRGDNQVARRWMATIRGRLAGLRMHRRGLDARIGRPMSAPSENRAVSETVKDGQTASNVNEE